MKSSERILPEAPHRQITIRRGQTSPVAVEDVARVLAGRVANPQPHIGKIYHLIGPQSENMHVYAQYSYLLAMIRGYRGD